MSLEDDYGDAPWYADEPWAGFIATELTVPDDITPPAASDVETILSKAFINDHCRPISGDCPAVAGALARFFDADALIWLVNKPGDPWPVHALVRKDDVVFDGLRIRDQQAMYEYLDRHLGREFEFEAHYEEHDPETFEILDETSLAQSIIDERLIPVVRGTEDWSDENPD